MNEDFVTEAIRNDRCLKAKRLLDRFESELDAELSRFGAAMQAVQPELFETEAPVNIKYRWNSGKILAIPVKRPLPCYAISLQEPGGDILQARARAAAPSVTT